MQAEDEVTILDAYRLESQELSVEFSDGTSVTLTVQEIFALREARVAERDSLKGSSQHGS